MKELYFIHVGKTGGNSLHNHFKNLLKKTKKKYIENLIQIHGLKSKRILENYYKIPNSSKINISYSPDQSIIIWIRDPISRMIACIKNYLKKKNLNKISDELFQSKNDNELKKFLNNVPHIKNGIESFFTDVNHINKKFSKKFFFVGRAEYWQYDFENLFLKITDNKIKNIDILKKKYHTHKQNYSNIKMKTSIVKRFKKFYEREYNVIKKMCRVGLVSKEYYEEIYNREVYYY